MNHPHRAPREEPSSPLIDEPGSLPVEPDEGLALPGEPPVDADPERVPDVPQ